MRGNPLASYWLRLVLGDISEFYDVRVTLHFRASLFRAQGYRHIRQGASLFDFRRGMVVSDARNRWLVSKFSDQLKMEDMIVVFPFLRVLITVARPDLPVL